MDISKEVENAVMEGLTRYCPCAYLDGRTDTNPNCERCLGTGLRPTDFGDKILEFVKTYYKITLKTN